jgi:hypothetical protein
MDEGGLVRVHRHLVAVSRGRGLPCAVRFSGFATYGVGGNRCR